MLPLKKQLTFLQHLGKKPKKKEGGQIDSYLKENNNPFLISPALTRVGRGENVLQQRHSSQERQTENIKANAITLDTYLQSRCLKINILEPGDFSQYPIRPLFRFISNSHYNRKLGSPRIQRKSRTAWKASITRLRTAQAPSLHSIGSAKDGEQACCASDVKPEALPARPSPQASELSILKTVFIRETALFSQEA